MFPDMRNTPFRETFPGDGSLPSAQQLYMWFPDRLRERLPSSWSVRVFPEQIAADTRLDMLLLISDPNDVTAQIVIEIKRTVSPRDVVTLVAQLKNALLENKPAMVVAPFIGPRAQGLLAASDINYLDTTGSLRLQLDRPALYIAEQGALHNPWTEDIARQSLRGPAAGRIVRALCDFRPPYGARELAERSQTPPGTVSKILGLLDHEALVQRVGRGKYRGEIVAVDWAALLRRWTQDYRFETTNRTATYLDPRGLDAFFTKLRDVDQVNNPTESRYAVTGSFASSYYAPIVEPRLAAMYVPDLENSVARLGLRPAERGANVLIAEPFDPVVFTRVTERDGITYSALSQVAADLLTSPGRGTQEGAALLAWMEEHEDDWRR